MNLEELLAELNEDVPDEEPTVLDLEVVRANLPSYDIVKVCDMVVSERYLGLNKEIGLMCMHELARRRSAGDPFNFEAYIEQAHKSLPVLPIGNLDLRSILGSLVASRGK
jgi:hypothetical protein